MLLPVRPSGLGLRGLTVYDSDSIDAWLSGRVPGGTSLAEHQEATLGLQAENKSQVQIIGPLISP